MHAISVVSTAIKSPRTGDSGRMLCAELQNSVLQEQAVLDSPPSVSDSHTFSPKLRSEQPRVTPLPEKMDDEIEDAAFTHCSPVHVSTDGSNGVKGSLQLVHS